MSRAAKGGAKLSSEPTIGSISNEFLNQYEKTPTNLKVLDLFCVCAFVTTLVQVVYAKTAGSFPFNAFLSGTFCCLGSFVLTLSLRMQLSGEGSGKSPNRAFVDYVFAMTVLFLAVWCYIG